MAQSIILKRSALPGKVPDTGSLNTGELAINTYDGKIFIKRSGNLDSIQSVVTTDSITTGSITLTQTASIGELVISQDANIQRDLFVIRDIITNNDIDAGGDISGSGLQVNDTLNIVHGQFNLSASTSITGAVGIDGDLTVLGAVNAQQFNINIISSSVIYQSGSSKFGDTIDDTHEFTGSIDVSGSIILNGIELGGSTNSGSFTGSFTGSFIGDGSGLRGVLSDELPRNGYDYNIDDIASINDFNATSSRYLVDFDIDAMIGTPLGHKTYITNFTGSTKVIPAGDSVRFHVHDVEVARIDENGFSGSINFPAGVVSGSSQLTSSYDARYVLSGSITQTTWDNIANKPSDIVTGSSQLTSSYDTRYVLSGSITQTTWDNIASKPSGIISGSSQLTASYDSRYALSGSIGASSISSSMMETIKYVGDGSTTSFAIPNGYYTKMINVYLNGSKLEESEYTETNNTTISITPAILSGSILEIVNFRAATLNQGLTRKVELYTATSNQTTFNTVASASLGNVDIHINGFKLPPTDFTIVNTNTITLATGSNTGELVEIGIYDGYFGVYLGYEDLVHLNSFTASNNNTSLNSYTGSNDTLNSLQTTRINQLASSTSSINLHTASLNSYTSSNEDRWTSFFTYSSSTDNRINNLESKSASIDISITNINSFTSSNGNASLNSYTSSLNNAIQLTGSTVSFLGDIVVYGTQSVINSTNVELADNILYLAPSGSGNYDLGIVGHYNDGTYRHGGIFRDASDNGTWKVFKGLETETTGAYVDTSGTGFALADFKAETITSTTLIGSLSATNGVVSGSSQVIGMLDSLNSVSASLISKTGSYATTGSNIFIGSQTITGSMYLSGSNNGSTPLVAFRASGTGTFQRGVQLLNPGMGNGDSIMYAVGKADNSKNMGQFYFHHAGDSSNNNRISVGLHSVDDVFNIMGSNEVLIGTTTTNGAGKLQVAGNIVPETNGTRDLGSASYRWSTVYTSDLSLNNGIGDWTIVEGEDDLFLYNNKKGKVYKFALTEVDPNVATPKKS